MLYIILLITAFYIAGGCNSDSEGKSSAPKSDMRTNLPTVIVMERWATEGPVRVRITEKAAIEAVSTWMENNLADNVPPNKAGPVKPECALFIKLGNGDDPELSKPILLFGQLDRSGRDHAISASAFDDLWKIFERYGEPMENP